MGFFTSGKFLFIMGLILVGDQVLGLFTGITIAGLMVEQSPADDLDVFPTVFGIILIIIGATKWERDL